MLSVDIVAEEDNVDGHETVDIFITHYQYNSSIYRGNMSRFSRNSEVNVYIVKLKKCFLGTICIIVYTSS